jgi:hypothetical protein
MLDGQSHLVNLSGFAWGMRMGKAMVVQRDQSYAQHSPAPLLLDRDQSAPTNGPTRVEADRQRQQVVWA